MLKLKRKKKPEVVVPRVLERARAAAEEDEELKESLSFGEQRLSEVLDKAIAISDECRDYKVHNPSANVSVACGEGNTFSMRFTASDGKKHEAVFTPYSLSQFGSKVGVPAPYLQKCLNKDKGYIADYNIREWLKDYDSSLLVRNYDDGDTDWVRGVLSEKYSICDTPDILDGIDRVLDLGNFTVRGNFVSPERFHIRLADREQMDVSGEDLFSGLTIDSSDVGRSTLRVNFMVYKKVCSNGLIIGKSSSQLFRQKHIGITAEDFRTGLEKGFGMYPVIAEKVMEQIERTRNSDSPMNFNYESDDELEKLIEEIRNNTKVLTPKGAQKVVDIMQSKKYEDSRWGYVNALTEVAQDLTLEKRLSLETYAGALLVA